MLCFSVVIAMCGYFSGWRVSFTRFTFSWVLNISCTHRHGDGNMKRMENPFIQDSVFQVYRWLHSSVSLLSSEEGIITYELIITLKTSMELQSSGEMRRALSNLVWWKMSLRMTGRLDRTTFEGPFQQHKPFCDIKDNWWRAMWTTFLQEWHFLYIQATSFIASSTPSFLSTAPSQSQFRDASSRSSVPFLYIFSQMCSLLS